MTPTSFLRATALLHRSSSCPVRRERALAVLAHLGRRARL